MRPRLASQPVWGLVGGCGACKMDKTTPTRDRPMNFRLPDFRNGPKSPAEEVRAAVGNLKSTEGFVFGTSFSFADGEEAWKAAQAQVLLKFEAFITSQAAAGSDGSDPLTQKISKLVHDAAPEVYAQLQAAYAQTGLNRTA